MQLPERLKSKKTVIRMNFSLTKNKVYNIVKTKTMNIRTPAGWAPGTIYALYIMDDLNQESGFLHTEGDININSSDIPKDKLYKYFYNPEELRKMCIDDLIDKLIDDTNNNNS